MVPPDIDRFAKRYRDFMIEHDVRKRLFLKQREPGDFLRDNLIDQKVDQLVRWINDINTTENDWRPSEPSEEDEIWRYLDFSQLVAMSVTNELWLSNVTRFKDPYEGTIPLPNRDAEITQLEVEMCIPRPLAKVVYSAVEDLLHRGGGCVSCWNIGTHQSAALWDQYVSGGEGVAIHTTVGKLKESIKTDENLVFGEIRYIDYKEEEMGLGALAPIFHKRMSFSHENELRVCLPKSSDFLEDGVPISIDINVLIDEVYTSPTANKWFPEILENTIEKFEIECDVKESDLYSDPPY